MSETPNSLRSSATSRLVLALGEGEIRGLVDGAKSIYFGDTALQAEDGTYNFQGVTWETRPGTPDQEHMAGFPAIESDVAVSAEVTAANPITRTIVNPAASAVRVRIQLPQGLMNQNMGNGNLEASSVTLAIDVRPAGEAWTRKVEDTISGKTTSSYERAYRVELTGQGPWDVKVTRITADSDSAYLRNATSWTGYTEIVDRKCSYPYTALLGVAVDSQKFGSSVQKLSADIYGKIIQVPSNYDPETRSYTGIWDGSFKWAWSDNAAWCFYDMLRNDRFGLGLSSVAVDKWGLYECGRYSDELVPDGYGGMEPRFTCNLVLQTQEDAYQVISAMASIFRGMAYWATGSVVCAQDRPEDPTHLVTPAHVVGGSLSYAGTDLKSRHTVAYVTWSNPADGCKPDLEIVENAEGIRRYGWRPTDVVAVGCRSRGMARRVGEWITQTDLSETDTLVFTGGYYYADCMPGNILKVLDPEIVNVRHSGAVKAATTGQVVLDAPVELIAGEDYLLSVVLPDGLVADVAVATAPGRTDTLDLATPLAVSPLPGALWVLTYAGAEARYFRVISNRETKPHLFEISAVERDPGKFDRVEQGWAFDAPQSHGVPTGVLPAPAILQSQEYLYSQGTGIAAAVLLSWPAPSDPRVSLHQAEMWREGGEIRSLGSTSSCSLDAKDLIPGLYTFRVRSLTRLGVASAWTVLSDIRVLGLAKPLPDVTGLACIIQGGQRVLVYDAVDDLRQVQFEVRSGPRWGSAQLIGKTPLTRFELPSGNGTYLVKATTGVAESVNSAIIVVDGDDVVANVIAERDEAAAGWTGQLSGGARTVSGRLRLVGQGDFRAAADVRAITDVRSLGGIAPEGVYQLAPDRRITLAAEALCNVLVNYAARAVSASDDFRRVPDVRALADVRGDYTDQIRVRPQIRTFLGGAWGSWQDFLPGQYAGLIYDFRVVLASLHADIYPRVDTLAISVDVPDRRVANRLDVPAEGVHVAFTPVFNERPRVVCTILAAQGGEDVELTDDDATGFFVRVRLGGGHVARTINYIATGY